MEIINNFEMRNSRFQKTIEENKLKTRFELRKKQKNHEFMKKREKIFKSRLEIVESNFDQITPEIKKHLASLAIDERLKVYQEMIISDKMQKLLYAVNQIRKISLEYEDEFKKHFTHDYFTTLYHVYMTKNHPSCLFEITWIFINVLYHNPNPQYKELLSNKSAMSFYLRMFKCAESGGVVDLINYLILLIGNVMHQNKDIINKFIKAGILKKLCNEVKEDDNNYMTKHSFWIFASIFREDIEYEVEVLKWSLFGIINYLYEFFDIDTYVKALESLNLILNFKYFEEAAIELIFSKNWFRLLFGYEKVFNQEIIKPALDLFINLFQKIGKLKYFQDLLTYGIIKFLSEIYSISLFENLRIDVLTCFETLTKINDPRVFELFNNGFMKFIIENFNNSNEKLQEKILIILTNFLTIYEEKEVILTLLSYELFKILLLNISERKNLEICHNTLEFLKIFIDSASKLENLDVRKNVTDIGGIDILDNFCLHCSDEKLHENALLVKQMITNE